MPDGTATNEIALPLTTGARAAAVGHFRSDKLLDIVLATPAGPKLLSNMKESPIRDDSASIPALPYSNPTAIAVLDYDGDGRDDLLIADGFSGLRLYHNISPKDAPKEAAPKFEDVSDKLNLGNTGPAAGHKGDSVLVADFNNDGRPDILFFADVPFVLLNTPKGFTVAKDTGLDFGAISGTPAITKIGTTLTLAVPHGAAYAMGMGANSMVGLYRCDSAAHFTNITPAPLASFPGQAVSVTFADLSKSGRQDLLVGVLRAPNRYFRNTASNSWIDDSEAIGLTQKIYNSRAIATLDSNRDGTPDLLLNNEGQDPLLLIGNPNRKAGAQR
jgi:hypothetical protein